MHTISRFSYRRIIFAVFIAVFILSLSLFMWVSYPAASIKQEIFLAQGTVPAQIATTLEDSQVVRSGFFLRVVLKLRGTAGQLVPGKYLFEGRQSVFKVASRITRGIFGTEQMKVTIPEGSTNKQVSDLILEKFPDFNTELFLARAQTKQGYLFPETYYLLSTSTIDVIDKLTDSFDFHVRDLQAEAISEGKDWDEIVTMASILEEEADNTADFKIVSGILWKRLEIGMALQVDVAPVTYERPGLPSLPISNPGLLTLDAALHPTTTEFLYYLTGKDGLMHYAKDFEEHKQNVQRYLK